VNSGWGAFRCGGSFGRWDIRGGLEGVRRSCGGSEAPGPLQFQAPTGPGRSPAGPPGGPRRGSTARSGGVQEGAFLGSGFSVLKDRGLSREGGRLRAEGAGFLLLDAEG
jgi:hypothetical protein